MAHGLAIEHYFNDKLIRQYKSNIDFISQGIPANQFQ